MIGRKQQSDSRWLVWSSSLVPAASCKAAAWLQLIGLKPQPVWSKLEKYNKIHVLLAGRAVTSIWDLIDCCRFRKKEITNQKIDAWFKILFEISFVGHGIDIHVKCYYVFVVTLSFFVWNIKISHSSLQFYGWTSFHQCIAARKDQTQRVFQIRQTFPAFFFNSAKISMTRKRSVSTKRMFETFFCYRFATHRGVTLQSRIALHALRPNQVTTSESPPVLGSQLSKDEHMLTSVASTSASTV